ncbi:MAG: hypothetical protein QNJ29_07360 [Rhizobiaceae bacterium]|nr:hypothetical protein [Rhizobiaceae bacterium]
MRKLTVSALLFTGFIAFPTIANAEGCTLDGIKLNCGKGNNASVLAALASDATSEVLSKPLAAIDNFQKPIELEIFRKSIEASWKKANRAELAERRRLKRRQISDEEFAEWSKGYDAARANYDAAMTLYRNLVWFGKNGKPAPEG